MPLLNWVKLFALRDAIGLNKDESIFAVILL